MEVVKKRKMEENGGISADSGNSFTRLTPEDARKIIERFTPDQLLDILQYAVSRHFDVLDAVRSIADPDIAQRKLFIRGLGWDTSTENLRGLFSAYGELEEAIVILDKNTGRSKGYGFVTFKHVDGALLALKDPSKTIDGRVTVTQLAAAGNVGLSSTASDITARKIYVANVPIDMSADKLLAHFSLYGEIEEGPSGFDKQTGKCRGFALFVYKKLEGAQAALVDPIKTIEGCQLSCKLANDGKKGKPGGASGPDGVQGPAGVPGNVPVNGMRLNPQSSIPGGGSYGGPAGIGSFGGFQGAAPLGHYPPNMSLVGNQAPTSLGVSGGYGGGLGGLYGGSGSTGYVGLGGAGSLGGAMGGAGAGAGAGAGSSLYRLPQSSVGILSAGYPESGPGLSFTSGYPGQHHQATGTPPVPRDPPGGMYPNVLPYY